MCEGGNPIPLVNYFNAGVESWGSGNNSSLYPEASDGGEGTYIHGSILRLFSNESASLWYSVEISCDR